MKRREREKRQRKEEVMRDQKHKAGEIWSKMLILKKRNIIISWFLIVHLQIKHDFSLTLATVFFYKFNFLFYIQTSSPKEHPTIDHCGAITYYMTLPCLGQHYAFLFSSFISLWILNTKKYLFIYLLMVNFCTSVQLISMVAYWNGSW